MNADELERLATMTEEEIITTATERCYKPYDSNTGKRVGGSKQTHGPDLWMNAANVRLWQLGTALSPIGGG